MGNQTMSDRLKDALGMLDSSVDAEAVDVYNDSDVVPAKGGELIPFEPKQVPTSLPPSSEETADIRADYVTSRNITYTLIDMAGGAVQGALEVAVQTQHPKAYQVLNELMNTMRGLSKDLLEMQKIHKEITSVERVKREAEDAKKKGNVTNNLNVIGANASLAEILDMISKGQQVPPKEKEVVDV